MDGLPGSPLWPSIVGTGVLLPLCDSAGGEPDGGRGPCPQERSLSIQAGIEFADIEQEPVRVEDRLLGVLGASGEHEVASAILLNCMCRVPA